MNPTWSMVFAALVAGGLAGFIVPDQPQSSSAPPARKVVAPVPAKSTKEVLDTGGTLVAAKEREIREIALKRSELNQVIETTPAPEESGVVTKNAAADVPGSCAAETWPYRTANCLDRTATVPPATTLAKVKRIDPATILTAEKDEQRPASQESQQKVVTAPSQPQSKPQARTTSNIGEQALENERPSVKPDRRDAFPPRKGRRLQGRNLDAGFPDHTYVRGPDGRIYLAPRYRPAQSPQYHYIR